MPRNKNATLRYRIIDGCLTNPMHPFPGLEFIRAKISEQLNDDISVSMIHKDFAAMKQIYSAPIKFNKTKEGYLYTETGFSIKEFPLTNDEISALDFSTALLYNLKDTHLFKQFENAINKLIEGYRISKVIGKSERQLIQVEEPVKTEGQEWLEPLLEAITLKNPLLLTYIKYGGEPKLHVLFPYTLKQYHNRWYNIGHSARIDGVLVLDRKSSLEKSKIAYVSDTEFNADDFIKYSFGITQIHEAKPEKSYCLLSPNNHNTLAANPCIIRKRLFWKMKLRFKLNWKYTLCQN